MPWRPRRSSPSPYAGSASCWRSGSAGSGTSGSRARSPQLSRRPGQRTAFLTLRDPSADMSLTVTCSVALLDGPAAGVVEGATVVVHARPQYYAGRGTLSLAADQIRQVGVGELLARLEHLRSVLAAEGLFAADRKRPLPFLPGVVGVVCGRASAAEKDVVENGRRRWPAVRFRVEEVAVQGPTRGDRGHRGAAASRRRPRGRRHRGHPRRRLAGGPAAVLQRGAGARRRRAAGHRS